MVETMCAIVGGVLVAAVLAVMVLGTVAIRHRDNPRGMDNE